MTDKSDQLAQLVAYLQPEKDTPMSHRIKLLEPFLTRGLATTEQVAALTGADYKRVGELLNDLTTPSFDRPAALRVAHVMLEGKRGRPQKLFLLTEDGAAALRQLFESARINAPVLRESVELNAAFAIMEVYTAAVKDNLFASVEKVFPFGEDRANIRADVFVQPPNTEGIIFEIEQAENQGTLPRLLDKLRRLGGFFLKGHQNIAHEVRILFNLPQHDRKTLAVWQEALSLVEQGGQLPFQLYWMPVLHFLENPNWTSVRGFQQLLPQANRLSVYLPTMPTVSRTPENLDMSEMENLLAVIQARQQRVLKQLQWLDEREHCRRVLAFFSILGTIYETSFFREHKNRFYSMPPTESLTLLREYLHEPQNQSLLAELRMALDWLHRRASWANYIMAANRILWDVFLRFHGVGAMGLNFRIELPGYIQGPQDVRVTVRLEVRLQNWLHERYRNNFAHNPEDSLAWVLEALLKYSYDLGLVEFPWRTTQKRRGT